jgi:hypothetical protein
MTVIRRYHWQDISEEQVDHLRAMGFVVEVGPLFVEVGVES